MGNEQSAEGQAVPETGLRLSTLCRYQAETGNEEGLGFSWFQASTDVSGLVLGGAHRWGYVLSHLGGQRLFKDTRQRFFVLLDHYICYFDTHAPETRMRGSIDLDRVHCHLELLPRPADRVDGSTSTEEGADDHRVEITRKTDDSSMVLCFSTASALQDWMKSIFDVQQRKATFSPLRHSASVGADGAAKDDNDESDDWSDVSLSRYSRGIEERRRSQQYHRRAASANSVFAHPWSSTSMLLLNNMQRRNRRRRRGRSRGTLDSPPPRSRGRDVPLSWADGIEDGDERSAPLPPAAAGAVSLGKASERLAGLPRGGRAAGGDGINSSLDEYGAFTTVHACIYEGWTRGLQPHGWGRMIFANGDYVEGWWEHDILEGSGEHTSREEGWTYRGGYVAGERHGPGRLVSAQGDVWECEWRNGVVAAGVSATHATPGGEVYQGGCAPSAENSRVPCRAGHGRLRRRNGEQVETQFRAGRAVDGAKGVVRFRNGAIFFGELQDAQPHGYGELYLSSVKSERRNRRCRPLAELDAMARDILWYKGDFCRGKPHGTGLVKYKEPVARLRAPLLPPRPVSLPAAAAGVHGVDLRAVLESGLGMTSLGTNPVNEEGKQEEGAGACEVPLALAGSTDEEEEEDEDEDEEEEDEEDDDTTDSEEEEDEDDDEEEGERSGERRHGGGALPEGGEEKATASVARAGQRALVDDGAGAGGGDADMEYEAQFREGVMLRHDGCHLRLAALRFGRAEIRRLGTLLRREEEAMSRLRSRGLCLLCNAEEMNALLVGCRHRVLCMGCAGRTDCCPVCKETIGKVVKTYST